MPMSFVKTQSAPDKKGEILDIAAREFAAHGYAAVSMRHLANRAKITPAALYHYYAGKEAMYYAVLKNVFADKAAVFIEKTAGDGTPEENLDNAIYGAVKLFSSDDVYKRLLQRELLDGSGARLNSLAHDAIEAPFQAIERLLGQLAPGADTRRSTTTAFALILGQIQLRPILKGALLTGSSAQENGEDALLSFAKYVKSIMLYSLDVKREMTPS